MKSIKSIIKYIIIFIIALILLFSILVATAKIPKSWIETNLKESVDFFKKTAGVETILKRRDYTTLHLYADSVLLNIIYCIDSENPVESVLWANMYKEMEADINNDFIKVVEEEKLPTEQYLRYWHGSMAILRPLLTILNIEQIYRLNTIILGLLATILFVLLWKKSKCLSILYLLAMIMIAFPIVPLCLEYSWTFYVMIISSIIAITIEYKSEKVLNILFFLTGMLTCYLDFLTTEIITIFVPIILVLIIRNKEGRLSNIKEGIIFVIRSSFLWGVAYVGMWLAKWILASIILNINALDYVVEEAMNRINGLQGLDTRKEMYTGAIFKNWYTLYPINIIKRKTNLYWILVGFIILLLFIDWKKLKQDKQRRTFTILLLIIAITPYLRYIILANHSYRHYIFTFRTQIITIIAFGWIILQNLNYSLIIKKENFKS